MGEVTIIGVDLAKNVFQVHGAAADGSGVCRKKLSRPQFARLSGIIGHGRARRHRRVGKLGKDVLDEQRGGPVFSTSFMPRSALAWVSYHAASFMFGLRLA